MLLPPSTTAKAAHEISLDGMQVDQNGNDTASSLNSSDDEAGAIQSRKRKRYGSGLGNLGNTCFMNSTLQCLAHTSPLRSYFLSREYERDLNRDNPLGTGGELATEFANLLMEMWGTSTGKPRSNSNDFYSRYSSQRKTSWSSSAGSSHVVYPRNFKYTLGKHAERFIGYNQHDSQELAMYLLDALHEDTNRISKKPYIEKPEQKENESDDVAAKKAWDLHLMRDDSKVLENFIGQIKSKVVCPRETCGRVSTTFEPVMYLSVPLPGTSETTISITFVGMEPNKLMKKFSITLSKMAKISDLAKKAALLVNESRSPTDPIDSSDIVIVELWNNHIYKYYDGEDEIAKINDGDTIFAYQVESVSSIQAKLPLEEKAVSPFEDVDENIAPQHSQSLKPDIETLTKLNKDWENVLSTFLRSYGIVGQMLNPKRKRTDERRAFLKKLKNFVNVCYTSTECKAALQSSSSQSNDGKMSPTSTVVTKLGDAAVADSQSLEEICQSSQSFNNVTTISDVAALEFCAKKFQQQCLNIFNERKEELKDGAEIEIIFAKPSYGAVSSRGDKECGAPLVVRISAMRTVYGLRQMLAERLKHVLRCDKTSDLQGDKQNEAKDQDITNMSEELQFICQVPLTYERASSYSSFHSSSANYRKLGSIQEDTSSPLPHQSTFALPTHEDEKEFVLDVIGEHGKIKMHFPDKDSFDDDLWKRHESQKQEKKSTENKNISVQDCIQKYCEIEQLDESEMWYCDRCKEHVPAWKHIHLYRTPPILIIHLKRFHYNSISHRRDKIDLLVDFPLKGLDLRDQVMHYTDGEDEPIYDCYAVSNHFGGLGGGHYTAYALNDENEWCNFDDSRVTTDVTESEVVSPAAYMLFYRRRDVKNDDDIWIDRPMPTATVSSLDSVNTGRMDIEKDSDDETTESRTMRTISTPSSTSPMIEGSLENDLDMDLQ